MDCEMMHEIHDEQNGNLKLMNLKLVVQCHRLTAVGSDDKLQTESVYVAQGIESGRAEAQ